MLKIKRHLWGIWNITTDFQRDISFTKSTDNISDSSRVIKSNPHEISKQSGTVRITLCTEDECKAQLDKLKYQIQNGFHTNYIVSTLLAWLSAGCIGLNLLLMAVIPMIVHSFEVYMTWIVVELFMGLLLLPCSLGISKMKEPTHIDRLKKYSIYYIVVCILEGCTVCILLSIHGIKNMAKDLSTLKNGSVAGLCALGEVYFVIFSMMRCISLVIAVIYQQRLFSICANYNITEMISFTKKKIGQM
jgi:hypothetical protein